VISEIREKLKYWRRKAADLQSDREKFRREIAVADERIRSLQEQYEDVKLEVLRAEPELEQREVLLRKANDYLEHQREELKDVQKNLTSTIEELQAAQASKLDSENELIGVRRNLSELLSRKSYLEATLAGLTERIADKKNEFVTLGLSLQEIEGENSYKKKAFEENTLILDTIFSKKDRVEEEIKRISAERKTIEAARKELVGRQIVLVNERERLLSKMDSMQKNKQVLTGFTLGAATIMGHENLMELGDRIGILRESLDVPVELETAISAALGEYLDVVLLTSDKNIDEILTTLEHEGVRGALIPMNELNVEKKNLSFMTDTGVIGIASDLIECPSHVRPAIDFLLGGVIVVENRQIAQQIVATLRDGSPQTGHILHGLRVVTLIGELFFVSGPVIGGKGYPNQGVNFEQLHSNFRNDIKEIEQKLNKIEITLMAENDKLTSIDGKEDQLNKELEGVHQAEIENRDKNRHAIYEYERSNSHIKLINKHRNDLEVAIQGDEQQLPEVEGQISQIDVLIKQERELIQRKEEEFDNKHSLAALQEEVARWKTKQAVLERGIQETSWQIEERKAISERASADIEALRNRLKDLDSSKTLVYTKKKQIGENEIKVSEDIYKYKQSIEQNEQTLLEKEHQQQDLIIKDSGARQALNQAEHQYAQARITLAQRQESMETLKHRIDDDFGLVSYEYTDGISGPRPLPIDGMVEQLPIIEELSPEIEDNLRVQRAALRRLGAVNPEAQAEYHEIRDRFQFLTEQIGDLQEAEKDIREVISELDELMQREFQNTFTEVADEFGHIFTRLFGGGSARLILTNPEDLTETGIDIEARLPGRREQGLSLLSGGERSLAATSLVFALLKVSPTPFCVLDEVDAMLDESNTGRFRDLLHELSQNTQFVVITHNRNTVQVADVIYGVTMGRDSSSQVISLKMDEVMGVVR
jgi:chromosome segregation protein